MRYAVIVLALIFGGAAIYWSYDLPLRSPKTGVDETASSTSPTQDTLALPRTPPAGYREYRNEQYRFAFFYPDSFAVDEFDEGGGARTITVQNAQTAQGFQIFITPYGEPHVSEERFRQDEPSGVRKNPKDILIDGATAASFYSTNPDLGETAEIWFIHGGYLYEVTTLAPLAPWLSEIMATWKFI